MVFHQIRPARYPLFAFAWLELVSHRTFMPRLLAAGSPVTQAGVVNATSGWFLLHQLLLDLFESLEPHMRFCRMNRAVQALYQGTLRVILVLLHDFPQFLCDFHFSFCDVIPATCIQLRNLLVSAFPRNMPLPDPNTNVKIDLLPEIRQPPRILSSFETGMGARQRENVDAYISARGPPALLTRILQDLIVPSTSGSNKGIKNGNKQSEFDASSKTESYDNRAINSLTMYVGMHAIAQASGDSSAAAHLTDSAHMDIFLALVCRLQPAGRYMFLNAVVNNLRFPNSHTYYFSRMLLHLFSKCADSDELVLEQITRVLLERLVVNRPHPWGLLLTFVELVQNSRYDFWNFNFTVGDSDVRRLVESVARSCIGPSQATRTAK
jgi:CCR4-NOT transcription complex subunit 1